MIDWAALSNAIMQLSGTGAILYIIVKEIFAFFRRRDDLRKTLTVGELDQKLKKLEADNDDRKRSDDLATNLAGLIGDLIGALKEQSKDDKAQTAALKTQSAELTTVADAIKSANTLEKERLRIQEHEGDENRKLLRDQATAVAGFPLALDAATAALKVTIEQTNVQSVKAVVETITKMSDDLGKKIDPVDQRLAEQTQVLVDVKNSLDALTRAIESTILLVPDQYKDIKDAVNLLHDKVKVITERLDAIPPAAQSPADPPDAEEKQI